MHLLAITLFYTGILYVVNNDNICFLIISLIMFPNDDLLEGQTLQYARWGSSGNTLVSKPYPLNNILSKKVKPPSSFYH